MLDPRTLTSTAAITRILEHQSPHGTPDVVVMATTEISLLPHHTTPTGTDLTLHPPLGPNISHVVNTDTETGPIVTPVDITLGMAKVAGVHHRHVVTMDSIHSHVVLDITMVLSHLPHGMTVATPIRFPTTATNHIKQPVSVGSELLVVGNSATSSLYAIVI